LELENEVQIQDSYYEDRRAIDEEELCQTHRKRYGAIQGNGGKAVENGLNVSAERLMECPPVFRAETMRSNGHKMPTLQMIKRTDALRKS
jgi:hypothetical protein